MSISAMFPGTLARAISSVDLLRSTLGQNDLAIAQERFGGSVLERNILMEILLGPVPM